MVAATEAKVCAGTTVAMVVETVAGAQPGFWIGGGPNLGLSTKRGSGGITPGTFLKNVHEIRCIIFASVA